MNTKPYNLIDEKLLSTILIVDDEIVNVKLLDKLLSSVGYTNILKTQHPREVLDIITSNNVDLIILDLNMPEMSGFDVMTQIHQANIDYMPAILVLTAQHSREYRIEALEKGARDFVTKPFDRTELLARVRNMLEVKLADKFMTEQNHMLEDMVRQRTQELHHTRLQVVQRLGRAAEFRDNETGMHIIRMSQMSALLGKASGMSEEECDLVLNASPMHDIGKIGIPDRILQKPGKLDADEWEIMKTHAQIGADLLDGDDSALLKMARVIALTHHEKWNGTGYPNGLAGEDIPLVGRIVAIADVFDALTSERPYKKAWPVDDAINLIQSERGKHFDPALVDHFMQIINDVIIISEKFSDKKV